VPSGAESKHGSGMLVGKEVEQKEAGQENKPRSAPWVTPHLDDKQPPTGGL
jgi:hypothetical protein